MRWVLMEPPPRRVWAYQRTRESSRKTKRTKENEIMRNLCSELEPAIRSCGDFSLTGWPNFSLGFVKRIESGEAYFSVSPSLFPDPRSQNQLSGRKEEKKKLEFIDPIPSWLIPAFPRLSPAKWERSQGRHPCDPRTLLPPSKKV